MKKLFLFVFGFVFGIANAQNNGQQKIIKLYEKPIERKYYVKERYFNGKIYVEGQAFQKVFNKKNRVELKRGAWKWYYRNGVLKDSIFYSDYGLPTGIEIQYHSDGKIHQTLNFGNTLNFKIRERNWLVAIPKDYSKTLYFNVPNVPRKNTEYLNGKKHGVCKYYNTKGDIVAEKVYERGKLKSYKKY